MTEAITTVGQSTLLIADDQPMAREILNTILVEPDYQLHFACDGIEALILAGQLKPDLIILDVFMPGINGIEVCRRLRSDPILAETPVIMITDSEDKETRLKGIEAGVDDFITKPFNAAELKARVRSITRLSRHRRLRTLELKTERDRTQAILEALGDAVIVADLNGCIDYLNPAAIVLNQYSSDEARGKSWRLFDSDQISADFHAEIQEVLATGHTWRGETTNRRKDGTLYEAALTVAPLFASDEADKLIGFVCVQRDITPLKRAEEAKNKFVSNVSHELRTPLSILTLLGDNLNTLYSRLNDQQRLKIVNDICKNTEILDELVCDILELSRIDSHPNQVDKTSLNLPSLFQDWVHDLLHLAQEKSQRLQVMVQQEATVLGNENQLRQVIRNLVNNAIKYTPAHGEITCRCIVLDQAAVAASLQSDPALVVLPAEYTLFAAQWVVLQVTDNGIGIPVEYLPHLFERFYRVKTESTTRGTGLGLSIALELVALQGGLMSVTSQPDAGTTFCVYLPQTERK